MVSNWIETNFSQLCNITRGASPRPIHEWISEEGIPWVKISDATSSTSRYIDRTIERIRLEGSSRSVVVHPGDLILSNSATPGIPKFMKIEACIHDGWLLLRNFRGIDKLFAYYLLLHERPALLQQGNGSVFTNLKTDILKNHKIRLPPLSEQHVIAGILGALDDKIELNRQMNATLEEMARAIFQSWFVDFDPVRAKAAGRRPSSLDDTTDALFPDAFEVVEGREVPKGWKTLPFTECVEVNPQRRLSSSIATPYLDMQNMPTHGHRINNWSYRVFGSGTRFTNGDTLVARITPCLENGKTAFVDFLSDGENGWGSTEYIVLRSKPPLPLEFAYYMARSEQFRSFAIASMTGSSGRQRVPTTSLEHFQVVVPSPDVAVSFGNTAREFMNQIKANSVQNKTLAGLRDTLLPKLLSGELRVRDAQLLSEQY